MQSAPSRNVLVDSNVYISLLRRGIDPAACLGDWIRDGDLVTCGMIRLEVERGIRCPKVRRRMARFFAAMIEVPTAADVWQAAADLAWTLDRAGEVLSATDLLIAACALSAGTPLLTDDRHFHKVPRLRVLPAREFLALRPV
jgi:predicted nucleic acid-binding protein